MRNSSARLVVATLGTLFGTPMSAQLATLDWKVHDVGQVLQLVNNMGNLWAGLSGYPGLIYSEFPPNSNEEHIGEAGIWIGAITPENDTLVSETTNWSRHWDFFPSSEPDDTIWVVKKGEIADIPYWPGYTGVSDQDFVLKYSDYHFTLGNHKPLFLDVIQTSYAWSSPPFDEMVVFRFYVIATQQALREVYVAYWMDGNVGDRKQGFGFALDDLSRYYEDLARTDRRVAATIDPPGGEDGQAFSPLGVSIYPPEDRAGSLRWTFDWYPGGGGGAPPDIESELYNEMSSGIIRENQILGDGSQFILSFGPLDLAPGDTLQFVVGIIFGDGEAGMLRNADRLDLLIEQDYKVPSPPPAPPLRVEEKNREVSLKWTSLPGDVDPETYQDPNRADNSAQPFEGYRVYKSSVSITGPWTLLAEYDVAGNEFGLNTGLSYEFTDVGLLNSLEYYYTVTAFSKPDTVLDFPSQESSVNSNAVVVIPGTAAPASVGQVAVVPNPYRGDVNYNAFNPKWEKNPPGRPWLEQDRRIQFINLPARCKIRVYSLAGDLVTLLHHNDPDRGYEDWNLTSSVGQAISSGIYLFTVEDSRNGAVQTGKFVVLK